VRRTAYGTVALSMTDTDPAACAALEECQAHVDHVFPAHSGTRLSLRSVHQLSHSGI
jgi:hypothetical protein